MATGEENEADLHKARTADYKRSSTCVSCSADTDRKGNRTASKETGDSSGQALGANTRTRSPSNILFITTVFTQLHN